MLTAAQSRALAVPWATINSIMDLRAATCVRQELMQVSERVAAQVVQLGIILRILAQDRAGFA